MSNAGEQEALPAEQVHHALKHGAPSSENLRFFKNFVVSYDSRLRNPRWVLEHITTQQTQGDGNRQASSMQKALDRAEDDHSSPRELNRHHGT